MVEFLLHYFGKGWAEFFGGLPAFVFGVNAVVVMISGLCQEHTIKGYEEL